MTKKTCENCKQEYEDDLSEHLGFNSIWCHLCIWCHLYTQLKAFEVIARSWSCEDDDCDCEKD